MNAFPELHKYDGSGFAEMVRTKQISPAESVKYAIARTETYNPKINSVIHKMYNKARKAAESKLPEGSFFDFMPYTPVFNVTGQPAMSAPLYWNESNLPIGMHFVGRFGDEATLFRLAGQLERTQPWFNHTPPGFSALGK